MFEAEIQYKVHFKQAPTGHTFKMSSLSVNRSIAKAVHGASNFCIHAVNLC